MGAPAWDPGPPESRLVIRPRRGRIMGSSILASLSEAGGNDPFHRMNRPLPSHSSSDADRDETRPTPVLMHVACPFFVQLEARGSRLFYHLQTSRPSAQAATRQFGNGRPILAVVPGPPGRFARTFPDCRASNGYEIVPPSQLAHNRGEAAIDACGPCIK